MFARLPDMMENSPEKYKMTNGEMNARWMNAEIAACAIAGHTASGELAYFVFTPRPIGPKGYCCPLRALPPHTDSCQLWLYTNIVQQILFIINTNIQPLRQFFFTQGYRSMIKVKDAQKFLLTRYLETQLLDLHFFIWSCPWLWRSPD